MVNNQRKNFNIVPGLSDHCKIFDNKIKEIESIEHEMSKIMLKIVESNVHGEEYNWFQKLEQEK